MITLRRATSDDVEFLVALYNDEEIEPFLGGRQARTAERFAPRSSARSGSRRRPDA